MITREQWISIAKEIDEPLTSKDAGIYRPYYFDDVIGNMLIFKSKTLFLTTIEALEYAKQHINKLNGNNKTLVMATILGDNSR